MFPRSAPADREEEVVPRTPRSHLAGTMIACAAIFGLALHAAVSVVGAVLGGEILLSRSAAEQPRVTAQRVLESGDGWAAQLRSEKFWSERRSGSSQSSKAAAWSESSKLGAGNVQRAAALKSSKRSSSEDREDGSTWYSGDGDNYRTVCVRLCDGYFWPISFSTTDDNFERDSKACESSCTSPARLFIAKTPGTGDPADLEDLKGNSYRRLTTAFLFRTTYDAACKCKPHPWEQQAMDRHRLYAAEAKRAQGDRLAAAEAARLKATLQQQADAERAAARVAAQQAESATRNGNSKPASKGSAKVASAKSRPATDSGDESASSPAAKTTVAPPRPSVVVTSSRESQSTVMRLGAPPVQPAAIKAPRPQQQAGSQPGWKKQILDGGSLLR
jgi:Protein of unknown function (DUF2865)